MTDTNGFRKMKIKETEGTTDEVEDYLREKFIDKEREVTFNFDEVMVKLRECYDKIIEILKLYVDMKEEYYSLIAVWVIGTYFHKDMNSYPYLFFNAMRGSGKTRTLKLIISMAKEGSLMASPTEAILFRMHGTLGLDELENIGSKEKSPIRELLNASYKKGTKIFRTRKKKNLGGEELVIEEFEPYRPIVMANIHGMEEVLGDRSITLILEKSNDPVKTRLIEDFENDETIKFIKETLDQCIVCSVELKKNIKQKWNDYIIDKYNTTHSTYTTYITHTTHTTLQDIKITTLFNKIDDSGLYGRNLELFLPLFFIADIINNDVFEGLIKLSKQLTDEKRHEEEVESRDVMLIDFVSKQDTGFAHKRTKDLVREFKEFIDVDEDWVTTQWFGLALKRLNLIIDKKRIARGTEVILNVTKAQEKLKLFRKDG